MRSQSTRRSRRTVCKLTGSLLAGATGLSLASIGASTDQSVATDRSDVQRMAVLDTARSDRFEVYHGVVDRIVDGEHVVILLEEDGEVVDELVEPRAELPHVEETDRVLVLLDDGEFRFLVPLPDDADPSG